MPPHKDPRPKTGREKAVRDDVVLGEGKVLEQGDYDQLIECGGEFKDLVQRQLVGVNTITE